MLRLLSLLPFWQQSRYQLHCVVGQGKCVGSFHCLARGRTRKEDCFGDGLTTLCGDGELMHEFIFCWTTRLNPSKRAPLDCALGWKLHFLSSMVSHSCNTVSFGNAVLEQ